MTPKSRQHELNAVEKHRLAEIKIKHSDAKIQMKYTPTGIGTNVEVIATIKHDHYIYDITDYDSW
jgi:hypothetical protein